MTLSLAHWGLPLLAGSVTCAVAILVWRRRTAPGARALVVLLAGVAVWTLCSALHRLVPDLATKIWVAKVQYLGIQAVAPALFVFALQLTGRQRWVTPGHLLLLTVIPVATLVLVWTNELHHLVWSRIGLEVHGRIRMGVYTHDLWFMVQAVYAYLLALIATAWLIRVYTHTLRFFRSQLLVMLIALVVPWLANAVYILRIGPWPHLDLTPLAFNVTGLALAWGLFRFRLSEVVPVARETVFEGLRDAVIVVDRHDRVVDFNPAAVQLVGLPDRESLGRPLPEVLADLPGGIDPGPDLSRACSEISLGRGDDRRNFEVNVSPLNDQRRRPQGHLIVWRDITERKRAEEEREVLITELRLALAQVKTLRGLVPICSSCKKIRDDRGQWRPIETYLKEHSQADFTHSICPDCKKNLYPELK